MFTGTPANSAVMRVRQDFVELAPRDGSENVDTIRRNSKLNDLSFGNEVVFAQTELCEAEMSQGGFEAHAVLSRRTHQDIDIAGKSRPSMIGLRVASDGHVLNFLRV